MMASCRIRYHSTRRFLRCVRRYATPCTRRIVCASVVNLTAIRWQRGGDEDGLYRVIQNILGKRLAYKVNAIAYLTGFFMPEGDPIRLAF